MKSFRAYILDLCGKKEGYTIEFKGAKGGFPGSFWETYSAFANTAGGIIVLGVIEKNHRFKPDGLTEDQIGHFRKAFWDNAHNPQKVSSCLLNENDVIVDHYTDGTWAPNLFQFYTRVLEKLYHAIPVKFKLEGDGRLDETPAHESLREAVCNSLIHCQWRMLEGVVIERYPDHLYFSNPGTMLITIEEFFEGGHSVCRNRILQKMFIVFGRGERLGSGADIIRQGWNENNWPDPEVKEHFGPNTDRVELTLRLGNVTEKSTETITETKKKSSMKTTERIKDFMRKNPAITLKEIAAILDRQPRTIEIAVKKLRERGEVVHQGPDNNGYWEVLK